jgi:Cu(I)/Ag(I) efflux system membrane fusion protein
MTPPKSPAKTGTAGPSRAGWVFALLLGLVAGRVACVPSAPPPQDENVPVADAPTVWSCSMHPQVRLPEAGQCPICFMDLIPLTEGEDEGLHPRALRVSENAAALAGLVTAPVERRAVEREVPMVGRVAFDETRLAYITAWVPSRLDRLFVDFTGVRVRKGDHLAEVYSPNLIATQQELLGAVTALEAMGNSTLAGMAERQRASIESARERLRLWGLQPEQIDAIVERGEPLEHVTITAPVGGVVVHKNAVQGDHVETGTRIYTIADLTRVWVQLDAYESDLAWLHYGQHVHFSTVAFPGEEFSGRISFIDPVLDDRTRTVKVRVNVENPGLRLKPDMFVRATVHAPMTSGGQLVDPELAGLWMCPMHPEAVGETPGPCPSCGMDLVPTEELGFRAAEASELPLVIPHTAPLVTGERAVVYVRMPGDGPPVYEGREVVLGPRAGDVYAVREGLEEGEQVVVAGAFKLDSELQIRARPSMMSPDDDEAHARGAAGRGAAGDDPGPSLSGTTPVAFRARLGDLIGPVVEATRALAAEDPEGARATSGALRSALDAIPMAALDDAGHAAWMPQAVAIATALDRFDDAADLVALRAALHDVSDATIVALDLFGWEGEGGQPAVFHCPMAFDGDGGDWIDLGDEVLNPWYGARMLRCGDRVRDLPKEP